jgi:hypothetical protein
LRKPSSIAAHGSLSLLQDGSSFLPSFLGSLSLLSTGKLQWFLSRRPMTEGGAEPIDWLVRPMKGAQVPYRKPMPKKKAKGQQKKYIFFSGASSTNHAAALLRHEESNLDDNSVWHGITKEIVSCFC